MPQLKIYIRVLKIHFNYTLLPPRRYFTLTPLDYMTVILYLLSLVSPTFHNLVKLVNTLCKVQMLNRIQPLVTYSPLDPNILLSTLFLSTRHQSTSLAVKDKPLRV